MLDVRNSDRWDALQDRTKGETLLLFARGWELGDSISVAESIAFTLQATRFARSLPHATDEENKLREHLLNETNLWRARHEAVKPQQQIAAWRVANAHAAGPHQDFNRHLTGETVAAGWERAELGAALRTARGGWQEWAVHSRAGGAPIPAIVGEEIRPLHEATAAMPIPERLEHLRIAAARAYSHDQKAASATNLQRFEDEVVTAAIQLGYRVERDPPENG